MISHVGLRQIIGVTDQDTGHIHSHIPVTNNNYPFMGEIKLELLIVGMTIIPTDKDRRWKAALEIFARNTHLTIRLRTNRIDQLIVAGFEIGTGQVTTKRHIPKIANTCTCSELVIDTGNSLDRLVIRSNPLTDEPVRRR